MKACYIRWKDACQGVDETPHTELGPLAELHEVGFLKRETEESYTLGMEFQEDEYSSRLWLTIPKVNVLEFHEFEIPEKRKRNGRR